MDRLSYYDGRLYLMKEAMPDIIEEIFNKKSHTECISESIVGSVFIPAGTRVVYANRIIVAGDINIIEGIIPNGYYKYPILWDFEDGNKYWMRGPSFPSEWKYMQEEIHKYIPKYHNEEIPVNQDLAILYHINSGKTFIGLRDPTCYILPKGFPLSSRYPVQAYKDSNIILETCNPSIVPEKYFKEDQPYPIPIYLDQKEEKYTIGYIRKGTLYDVVWVRGIISFPYNYFDSYKNILKFLQKYIISR